MVGIEDINFRTRIYPAVSKTATQISLRDVAFGLASAGANPFFFFLKRWRRLSLLGVLAVAVWLLLDAGYIHAKALLGQYLIRDAWQQSLERGEVVKPWSWADTWPVARLTIPEQQVDQIVLAGDHGQALAFGPGMVDDRSGGALVISGHRDTHFQFMRTLSLGAHIELQRHAGLELFRVVATEVVDLRNQELYLGQGGLLLVTCWPFDGVEAETPWRYVVVAEKRRSNETSNGNW